MTCQVKDCRTTSTSVCGGCYQLLLRRFDALLEAKNLLALECHEMKAEIIMLQRAALNMAERITAQSELLSKQAEKTVPGQVDQAKL